MITFWGTTLDTIVDLHKLASKYNYEFEISINDNYTHIDDFEITDELADNDDDLKFIRDNDLLLVGHGTHHTISLKFNKGAKELNVIHYSIFSGYVEIDLEKYELIDLDANNGYELYADAGDNTIYYDFETTEVFGFEDVKHKPNVYRTGILIREFYYMVCELVGETPVKRNY